MTADTRADWAPSAYPGPHASPGFLLWRDFMRWQRGLNARLRPFELTQPQFAILAVCGWMTRDDADLTQSDLVDFLGMDRMHVSQIATRLDADGLIERAAASGDKRSKRVRLTARGRDRLARALPVVEAYDEAFFSSGGRR